MTDIFFKKWTADSVPTEIITAICQLQNDAFGPSQEKLWTENTTETFVTNPHAILITGHSTPKNQKHDIPVCFIIFHTIFDHADLISMAVSPSYQALGLASKMMNFGHECLQQQSVSQIMLEVRINNLKAQKLYVKQGYRHIHTRENYYSLRNGTHEHALIMQRVNNLAKS